MPNMCAYCKTEPATTMYCSPKCCDGAYRERKRHSGRRKEMLEAVEGAYKALQQQYDDSAPLVGDDISRAYMLGVQYADLSNL